MAAGGGERPLYGSQKSQTGSGVYERVFIWVAYLPSEEPTTAPSASQFVQTKMCVCWKTYDFLSHPFFDG